MDERQKHEYSAWMEEYKVLRAEIIAYSQRIDRTIGIYFTALFGLLGFLLRPDSDFSLGEYLEQLRSTPSSLGLFVFIGLLNALLMVRIQSFYLAVLALAQYTSIVLKPQVDALVGRDVLRWDSRNATRAKRYWLPTRGAAQGAFALVAVGASVSIAVAAFPALSGTWLWLLWMSLCTSLGYVLVVFGQIVQASRRFHEVPEEPSPVPREVIPPACPEDETLAADAVEASA